ncbi:hypothetical protein JOM56_011873, partial [Amanita muscaria]
FTLARVFFILATADAVGLTELDGRVGHHGAQGCRMGCDMKGRHKPSSGHYCAAHLRPNGSDQAANSNHPDYDFSRDPIGPSPHTYMEHLFKVAGSRDQADYERNRKLTGISKPSIISGLNPTLTLPVPRCFTVDLMHLLFINLGELLIPLWRGTLRVERQSRDRVTWSHDLSRDILSYLVTVSRSRDASCDMSHHMTRCNQSYSYRILSVFM